jgi:hypothetical protein
VRVRIKALPKEKELDGIALDQFVPGMVRDVSASVAAWLITQGYADPEMRRPEPSELDFSGVKPVRAIAHDRRRRRRSTDR